MHLLSVKLLELNKKMGIMVLRSRGGPLISFRHLIVSYLVYPFLPPEPVAMFAKEQLSHREVQIEVGASAMLSCEWPRPRWR